MISSMKSSQHSNPIVVVLSLEKKGNNQREQSELEEVAGNDMGTRASWRSGRV